MYSKIKTKKKHYSFRQIWSDYKMNTSNNSLETLGSKISSVIYPKTSEENLINTIGICFESNDGV